MARQQRVSSILIQRCLRFLGHIVRMPEERLPRQLLVSAPVGGKHAPGGQKRRWNDVVVEDLNQASLSGVWREQALDHDSWRSTIKHSVELLNDQAEATERSLKDQKKKRREERLLESEITLHCSHHSCSFRALTRAGLANHLRQRHSSIHNQKIPCDYCQQLFHQQGLGNHKRFCRAKPSL